MLRPAQLYQSKTLESLYFVETPYHRRCIESPEKRGCGYSVVGNEKSGITVKYLTSQGRFKLKMRVRVENGEKWSGRISPQTCLSNNYSRLTSNKNTKMTHCCTDCYVTQWKARKIHKIIRVNWEFIMNVLLAFPTKFLSFVQTDKVL